VRATCRDIFDRVAKALGVVEHVDIDRHPNPHLPFGIAEHYCLGVHVARLEGRVCFEELLATYPSTELVGEPVRTRSNLNNALKHLPIRLGRA